MDGYYLATFYESVKSFLKPLEGRMEAKSEPRCSLTCSASLSPIVMETSQAMEVEMLDGSSVMSSFSEL